MSDNIEVIKVELGHVKASVEECRREHRNAAVEHREQIIAVHKRMDKMLEAMNQLVLHDQKISTMASHVHVLEEKLKDYETVKSSAGRASNWLDVIGKIVVSTLVLAFLGLIIVKGGK